jgi:hypothetical protein
VVRTGSSDGAAPAFLAFNRFFCGFQGFDPISALQRNPLFGEARQLVDAQRIQPDDP